MDNKKILYILMGIVAISLFSVVRKINMSMNNEKMENVKKDIKTLKKEYEEKQQEKIINETLPPQFTEDRELPNLRKDYEELNRVEQLNWSEFLDVPKDGWWAPEQNEGIREVSKGVFPY